MYPIPMHNHARDVLYTRPGVSVNINMYPIYRLRGAYLRNLFVKRCFLSASDFPVAFEAMPLAEWVRCELSICPDCDPIGACCPTASALIAEPLHCICPYGQAF